MLKIELFLGLRCLKKSVFRLDNLDNLNNHLRTQNVISALITKVVDTKSATATIIDMLLFPPVAPFPLSELLFSVGMGVTLLLMTLLPLSE